jgi:hypothetical protein
MPYTPGDYAAVLHLGVGIVRRSLTRRMWLHSRGGFDWTEFLVLSSSTLWTPHSEQPYTNLTGAIEDGCHQIKISLSYELVGDSLFLRNIVMAYLKAGVFDVGRLSRVEPCRIAPPCWPVRRERRLKVSCSP